MLKKIILTLCILQLSCNVKNESKNQQSSNEKNIMQKEIKRLDIDEFKKKAKIVNQYFSIDNTPNPKKIYNEYFLLEEKNRMQKKIWGEEDSFFYEEVKEEGRSYFETFTYLAINGNLINYKKESLYGFLIIEEEYNDKGIILKKTDYDKEFLFNFDCVKKYLESKHVNLDINNFKSDLFQNKEIPAPIIKRSLMSNISEYENYPYGTQKIWRIEAVEGIYKGVKGIFYIDLDGDTGAELLVKQYRGKKSGKNGLGTYADYEIIYKRE